MNVRTFWLGANFSLVGVILVGLTLTESSDWTVEAFCVPGQQAVSGSITGDAGHHEIDAFVTSHTPGSGEWTLVPGSTQHLSVDGPGPHAFGPLDVSQVPASANAIRVEIEVAGTPVNAKSESFAPCGGVTPMPTGTSTATLTGTATDTPTATATGTAGVTLTATPTGTATSAAATSTFTPVGATATSTTTAAAATTSTATPSEGAAAPTASPSPTAVISGSPISEVLSAPPPAERGGPEQPPSPPGLPSLPSAGSGGTVSAGRVWLTSLGLAAVLTGALLLLSGSGLRPLSWVAARGNSPRRMDLWTGGKEVDVAPVQSRGVSATGGADAFVPQAFGPGITREELNDFRQRLRRLDRDLAETREGLRAHHWGSGERESR